jgi:hypothetical protein
MANSTHKLGGISKAQDLEHTLAIELERGSISVLRPSALHERAQNAFVQTQVGPRATPCNDGDDKVIGSPPRECTSTADTRASLGIQRDAVGQIVLAHVRVAEDLHRAGINTKSQ